MSTMCVERVEAKLVNHPATYTSALVSGGFPGDARDGAATGGYDVQ